MTILSLLPLVSLLLCLIVFKLSVAKSGAISLIIALIVALGFFGMPFTAGLPVSVGKALWLALFVSLIVWFALFLYHLVDDFKAIEVINKNISILVEDKFVAFVLLAWLFTGLLQGMAGFGVPASIVTPILIALGFNPIKSLAAALLGHSWAVTFGSLGAAFFVVSGLTGIPEADLGIPMWIFNTVIHFLTGIGVCFLYDGFKGIRKGFSYVFPVSLVMTGVQFAIVFFGAYPLASLLTAISGIVTMFGLYKLRSVKKAENSEKKSGLYRGKLTLLQASLPYIVIIVMALSFQFVPNNVMQATSVSFDFPGFETNAEWDYAVDAETGERVTVGHVVAYETDYNPIRLFRHPAILLLGAAVTAVIVFKRAGVWDGAVFLGAVKKTVKKGIPATLALLALGTMSLVMMDSGMTLWLAQDVAALTGGVFPLFSPFFGVLGSFLTGNNTNANVLFGVFQYEIANHLNVSTAMMTASQSMSGGLGVSIGPTIVLLATLASGQQGQESTVLKKLIPIVLLIALAMGVVNFTILTLTS